MKDFLNNGDIYDQKNLVIQSDINQREDIKIVNKEIWDFFYFRYGGGPILNRPWISDGATFSVRKVVEVFYRSINIVSLPKRRKMTKDKIVSLNSEIVYISRTKSLQDLKAHILEIKYSKENKINPISNETIRFWKINSNSSLLSLKENLVQNLADIVETDLLIKFDEIIDYLDYIPKLALRELEFADTDIMVIEESEENIFEVKQIEIKEGKCENCNFRKALKYFCVCKEVGYCSQACKDRDEYYHLRNCKRSFKLDDDNLKLAANSRKGLVGLQNLGNTCFMNTSLQCMSNCKELTQYFLADYYLNQINFENPIGTQGVLVRAYSNLLKNLWYGSSSVYSPWNFKKAIATFQSIFTGYQQHDTQEFLNYLLDGLHEDLNRVLKKPIVEKDESDKEDKIKANEEWNNFLRRNQSVLVDLFYGQYKSTLYCPDEDCKNISITFDPFLSLSLPLTIKDQKFSIQCYFIFYDIKIKPIGISLNFYSDTSIMALRNKIATMLNIHPFSFVILKMDGLGNLDFMVNSSMKIDKNSNRKSHQNQLPFFLFQIDPRIHSSNCKKDNFYSNEIKLDFSQAYEELENKKEKLRNLFSSNYEENESGKTIPRICFYTFYDEGMLVNTDNNYGLDDDWIKIVLQMRRYDDNYTTIKKKLIFPRVIYANKNWTAKQLHQVILEYFGEILKTHHKLKHEDLWSTFFPDLESQELSSDMSFKEHMSKAYPYILRIKNIFNESSEFCVMCKRKDCNNCLLPCSNGFTLNQLLQRIPIVNENQTIDNSYYFLTEEQKAGKNELDFILEVTWLNQYTSDVKTLNDKVDYEIEATKSYRQDCVDISACFKTFERLEKLEENNEWYCPKCKNHQRALKKIEIYKSPHFLIIHLKRFRNHSKIDSLVDFPIEGLDISEYVISKDDGLPLVYDLFAIANHYGSLGGGHYVAYAKNEQEKNWYCFNDSSVSRIEEEQLVSPSAYVLFYRRRDLHLYINSDQIYKKTFEDYENIKRIDNLKIESGKK
jgi:ubiquitin C-terminal hydrolase